MFKNRKKRVEAKQKKAFLNLVDNLWDEIDDCFHAVKVLNQCYGIISIRLS